MRGKEVLRAVKEHRLGATMEILTFASSGGTFLEDSCQQLSLDRVGTASRAVMTQFNLWVAWTGISAVELHVLVEQ